MKPSKTKNKRLLNAAQIKAVFERFSREMARRYDNLDQVVFIGIRTPWTLSSDRVWEKTHQIGSTLFMLAGALAVIGSPFGGATAFWMLMIPLFGSTIFLVIYSYVLYRRETSM